MPVVKKTPVELSDQAIAQGAGRKLAYFGYEFEVPWEVDEAKSKQVGQMQLTPDKVGLLTPRREAVGSAMLLLIKGIMMPYGGDRASIEFRQEISEGFRSVTREADQGHSTWRFIMKRTDSASFSLSSRTAPSRQSLRQRSTALSNP